MFQVFNSSVLSYFQQFVAVASTLNIFFSILLFYYALMRRGPSSATPDQGLRGANVVNISSIKRYHSPQQQMPVTPNHGVINCAGA